VTGETVDVQVTAGSPEEFQSDVELAIRTEFPPDELRELRQRLERDGRAAIRNLAEEYIAEETANREAYVDAMADAFLAVVES
jgi:hypothetical protein